MSNMSTDVQIRMRAFVAELKFIEHWELVRRVWNDGIIPVLEELGDEDDALAKAGEKIAGYISTLQAMMSGQRPSLVHDTMSDSGSDEDMDFGLSLIHI